MVIPSRQGQWPMKIYLKDRITVGLASSLWPWIKSRHLCHQKRYHMFRLWYILECFYTASFQQSHKATCFKAHRSATRFLHYSARQQSCAICPHLEIKTKRDCWLAGCLTHLISCICIVEGLRLPKQSVLLLQTALLNRTQKPAITSTPIYQSWRRTARV